MSRGWSIEDDETLIKFVEKHEILYNMKCPDYRDTHLKYKLWCEIGNILGRDEIDCSKRWGYVRDYYIRRKSKPSTYGEAAKRRYDLLRFLDKNPNQRYSVNGDIETTSRSGSIENVDVGEGPRPLNEDTDGSNVGDNYKFKYEFPDDEIQFEEEAIDDPIDVKKRKISDVQVKISPTIIASNDLDENDLFFSSMAKIVKKLPRHVQTQLRLEIGSLVGNAELRCIEDEAPITPNICNVVTKTDF